MQLKFILNCNNIAVLMYFWLNKYSLGFVYKTFFKKHLNINPKIFNNKGIAHPKMKILL